MRHLILLKLVCFAFFLSIGTVVADDVPNFDVTPSCRVGASIGTTGTAFSACLQKEKEAHDQLKAQWTQFKQRDKEKCIRLCNCGGVAASYVELLTCLQMSSPEGSGIAPDSSTKRK